MRLQNKTAIITGGESGIGQATAILFAKEGANIVITTYQHQDEAEKTLQEIKNLGRECLSIPCNLKYQNEIENLIKKTIEKFHYIDILVNNAGMLKPSSFAELTEEIWNETLDINLKSIYYTTKAALPYMKQKGGKIINLSSIAGIAGSMVSAPYSAAKAGIIGLTKTLAKELAKFNIAVNAIAPSAVQTNFLKQIKPEIVEKVIKETPLQRIANPIDIAKVILFFASEDSNYVTGQTLIVDGGRL